MRVNTTGDGCTRIREMWNMNTKQFFPGIFDCNFGSVGPGICEMTQVLDDNFDWSLTYSETPSQGTGPASGLGPGGYYAYIEASAPRAKGDVAR